MIGFITIGQTPRNDLLIPYENVIESYPYKLIGALDGIGKEDIPPVNGAYPLITKLNDGSLIKVEKEYLETQIQRVVYELERDGIEIGILLCAGDFSITSRLPILQPNRMLPPIIQSYTKKPVIGVVIPIEDQAEAAMKKWNEYGFNCKTHTIPMSTANLDEESWNKWISGEQNGFDTIIFDCTGYSPKVIKKAKSITKMKVFGTDELLLQNLKTYLYL